ncbi:MAG: hypothetical protein IPI33_14750 [Dehalococcoidia bacterium]|jgi:hypothetical protein|uniref:hypothetical protein n=1 Tax=Candidatus Amarobacter glycogenicus TaxID=3140699 RepID=UPI001D497521|nr:hypothetical protein [Dehalococcoidia bacterium]MBK6560717.1 hypothetical protein [Dehalococcoidia bacterium]MBK7124833.1 hypothetical protein [Dehalococcoidia bacterium]MBK7329872.1 hypothetical protein [Dehalococcoidia bacterium]MBK7726434.1 hypothetical protein [Dehalococcoidia bacterium]
MGREEIAALIAILTAQNEGGSSSPVRGTWSIHFDKQRAAFTFDKCENAGYCEERPAVIALDGSVLDPGGPLFG